MKTGTMCSQLAVLFTLLGCSIAMTDLTKICEDSRHGDVVANPFDCQAYFICSTVPMLRFCEYGLHFDAERKVCNWPLYANCQPKTPDVDADNSIYTTPDPSLWNDKPRPTFMAIDVASGQIIDPMDGYDPRNIECRHFGAYFLPHPHHCHKYFICAYGHLLQHNCGQGTKWSYKRTECEISEQAQCYAQIGGFPEESDDEPGKTHVSETTAFMPTTTPQQTTTVCYPVYTDDKTTNDVITGTPWYPTGDTTWYPTGSSHTRTTVAIPATTPRADAHVLECPANKQAYLPHATDCRKYYICIVNIPVMTSCPKDLYWDQTRALCDTAEHVNCYKN